MAKMTVLNFAIFCLLVTGCVSSPERSPVNARSRRHQPQPVVKSLQKARDPHHEMHGLQSLPTNDISPPVSNIIKNKELIHDVPSSEYLEGNSLSPYEVAMREPPNVIREHLELNDSDDSHIALISQRIPPWLVCRIMERIAAIFQGRLSPNSGNQFAVLAIIPESVQQPDQIEAFLAPEYEDINYRFTRPTRFQNQNCRTHAEIVAMEGIPNDQNVLERLWNAFINNNPRNPPLFTVLYTWIHPCRECTSRIINHFGAAHGDTPVYNIPTFIGRTTSGNLLRPPLSDQDRTDIADQLLLHVLRLFVIRLPPNSMDNQAHLDSLGYTGEEMELCNSCKLNTGSLNNIYNCDDTGPSNPDNAICPNLMRQDNNNIVKGHTNDPCCEAEPVYTAAQGQKCKSDSPCGYYGKSYAWCYLESGSWEYCCTGACGNHGNTKYDWCLSGSQEKYCKRDPHPSDMTAKRVACLNNHPCGYYGKEYTWCYQEGGGWDYCCTSSCDQHGEDYDWCTAGNTWQYCKRDLPYDMYSAKGQKCKSSFPCGYHGNDYAWCYLEEGDWDYCCTGDCGPHGNKYDWCTSGNTWSMCRITDLPSVTHTYNLKTCKSTNQCGYHGEEYAWCYTTDGSWDYCCTSECGLNGQKYDWCTTGMVNKWQYCKHASLPETKTTVTGTSCRPDSDCGYHGKSYSWCWTAANSWDYCCSSTCGKYDTSENICATGDRHHDCCCSEYQ